MFLVLNSNKNNSFSFVVTDNDVIEELKTLWVGVLRNGQH
jgi:hypothetical protein